MLFDFSKLNPYWNSIDLVQSHPEISPDSYHFEGSLDINALAPGHSWVGETVTSAPPARNIYSLSSKIPEGLRNHKNGIMSQGWCVLKEKPTTAMQWQHIILVPFAAEALMKKTLLINVKDFHIPSCSRRVTTLKVHQCWDRLFASSNASSAAMLHWPSAECFWLLEILFHPSVPSAGGTAGRQCCLGWWSGSLWCWPHQKKPCPGSYLKNPRSKEHSQLTVKKKIFNDSKRHICLTSVELLFTKLHQTQLCVFLLLCCSHQVGEDVVVSSAVLSWGHHLQVTAEDTMSHIHNSQSAKSTQRQQKAAVSEYLAEKKGRHSLCTDHKEHVSPFVHWCVCMRDTHIQLGKELQWQALFLLVNFKI